MFKQFFLRIILVLLLVFTAITVFTMITVFAQSEATDSCEAVRYLMANNITPYDMDMGGGRMGDNTPIRGEMPANHYADFWSFTVTQENESGTSAPVITMIQFENASDGLEFALFKGMLPELEFIPLADTEFTFDRDDTYTIVVRRTDLLDTLGLEYTLSLVTDSRGQINPPEEIDLSNSVGEGSTPPSEFNGGQLSIQMPLATVLAHADAINLLNTRQGQSTQVYFPDRAESNPASYNLQLDDRIQDMRFLAGDMALSGRDSIYFLKNYDYASRLDSSQAGILDLSNITYADGTEIAVTWDVIQGVWILDTCAGFKLTDGRSFVGTINAEERFVSFTGNLDDFTIAFAPPQSDIPESDSNNSNIEYQAQFNWAEIREESEITYASGVFDFPLTNERRLVLQSSNLQIISTEKTDVIMEDMEAILTLDWVNMTGFTLQDGVIHVDFSDEARSSATFERSAVNLQRFEAVNDIIRIIYKPDNSQAIFGEERLIFSASEGYVEIITPQGLPEFDGRAMPDQEGYIPRALNNTGAECYPVNTILPEANCPPNGELNPANGNLFYAVLDMSTTGSTLNLEVIRSYNSRLAHIDSPFGFGWSTPFRLDYNVPFSMASASRQITPDSVSRVGLDVTWASRGIVSYITPTGSRHQFVNDEATYESGTLTAVTMPNWTLSRESISSETWTLEQIDGLSYTFDRVGRLLSYTDGVQTISVNTVNGSDRTRDDVTITDGTGRQIALSYDEYGHVIRSVLSDTSNELITEYSYTDGFLTTVSYPDGTDASYVYDESGHLIEHNDSRAPIHPHMLYNYDADGNVETIQLLSENGDAIPHRFYSLVMEDGSSNRRAILIDENNNRREYIYRYTEGELKAPSDTFTLTHISNPLAEVDDFENRGQRYQYENGLMTRIVGDTIVEGQGRGAVSYEYNDFGQIQCIACLAPSSSVPSLEVIYQPDPDDPRNLLTLPRAIEIHYANGTLETFSYDENGQIVGHTETSGAIYTYEWVDGRIAASIREQDEERVDYSYNSAGQIISEVRTLGESIHQIEYEYDWLGRVTEIRDSASGNYALAYNDTETGTEIIITDPIAVRSRYIYDRRNRLVEMSVSGNEILSLTTYAYDIYDNLTEETRWLIDDTSGIPITTTYLHERRPTIPPLTEEDAIEVINGTQITVNRPGFGEERYSFDALGRTRRVEDPFQRTYYDYVTSENTTYRFGMLIQQQTLMSGATQPNMINYLFDGRYQLREVRSERQGWEIGVEGENSIRQDSLRMQTDGLVSGLQSVAWDEYSQGVPTFTDVRQGELPLQTNFNILNAHRAGNRLELDFEGRPTAITNGAGDVLYIAYCPAPNGAIQEVYASSVNITCDSAEFDVSMTYDASGRLVESIDEIGRHIFNYIPLPDTNTWQVEVIFSNDENEPFTWNMIYDGIGNLMEWRDADGFVHQYSYDTLGRLTSTIVQGQAESSYIFRYNDANLLLEQTNGLGQGFLYEYNDLGQLLIRLDNATADSTHYAYTPDGKLSTIITSDGSMTSYLYEDTLNPERLTTIIEPTGNRHTFTWDDQDNILIYTDPLQNVTRYYFDGNGLLWRIDDPLQTSSNTVRTSEILYNDAGQVESLLFDSRANNTAETNFTVERSTNNTLTIREDTTNWASTFSFALGGKLLEIDGLNLGYDPLGRLSSILYNENAWTLTRSDGNPLISLLDGYGNATELRYDSLFREVSKSHNGEVISSNYSNNTIVMTLPDGTVNTYVFSSGNIQENEAPSITRLGNDFRIRYFYTQDGLLTEIRTEECHPNETDINTCATDSKSISFVYDDAGRPLSVINADGHFETFTYDAVGNIAVYQTENGRRFNYSYDEAGRLSHITSPSGIKLLFQHNTRDRVVGICRTRADVSQDYTSCVESGGVLENYSYDALGRMTQRRYNITEESADVLNYQYNFEATSTLTEINGQDFSINMSYTDLGRLSEIQDENTNVSFVYDGSGRISASEDINYTYNLLNQLVTSSNLTYESSPMFLSLVDSLTGQSISYTSDEGGRLSNINDTLILSYPESTNINIERADGLTIQQGLNQSGDVQAIDYEGELSILHQSDARGTVQRQVISIPNQDKSYSITISYDNDDRPLLMQITNVQDLKTLYLQTFTYNNGGLLVQETRQYQDDTRAIINYEYANSNQLTQQLIQIIRPLTSDSFVSLSNPNLQVQENSEVFTVDYIYNEVGNLTSIIQTLPDDTNTRVECARYDYDVLNRLTRVRQVNTFGNESQIIYSYDTFNRLITAGNYTLNYEGNKLFSVRDDTNTHYFGGLSEQAPSFTVDGNDNITWLYNDGRERISGVALDGSELNTIWLFDPLHRYISLDSPLQNINACQLSGIPNDIPDYLALQPYGNNQVWDIRSNLYFADGRAYDPEQASYLQGSLFEINPFNYLYEDITVHDELPFVADQPAYSIGLDILNDAEMNIASVEGLSADVIIQQFVNPTPDTAHPLVESLIQARIPYTNSMQGLVNLPILLQTQYNLPAPYRDLQTGALMMSAENVVGMGGTGQTATLYPVDILPGWSDYQLGQHLSHMPEINSIRQSFHTFVPWSIDTLSYQDIQVLPSVAINSTPSDVWDWLPKNMETPTNAVPLLDFAEMVVQMPSQPRYVWIDDLLKQVMPNGANLPIQSSEEWLERWFSNDILGLRNNILLPTISEVAMTPSTNSVIEYP